MKGQDHGEAQKRLEDLDDAIERFHREVRENPELWRDAGTIAAAFNMAKERLLVQNSLDRELHQRFQRERAERYAARDRGDNQAPSGEEPPPDPLELHRWRAVEGFGQFIHAMDYVRRLTHGRATYVQDLERRARLRWLLDLLASIHPQLAEEIAEVWRKWAAGPDAMAHRVARFERETIEELVIVLAPLLESNLVRQ